MDSGSGEAPEPELRSLKNMFGSGAGKFFFAPELDPELEPKRAKNTALAGSVQNNYSLHYKIDNYINFLVVY